MKSAEKFIIIYFLLPGVLCREFSISLPESVEGVRGLCVVIPCSFEINEQYDKDLQGVPAGIWFKDGTDHHQHKVFNSTDPTENRIEGKIVGDLLMKNCTTIFYNITERHSGDYYFRIEASGLKYTYTTSPSPPSSPVSVRVKDSPITPSIRLFKEDQEKLEEQKQVLEGTSVRIMCSAPSPPCLLKPPTFTWNFLPEEGRQEQNHNSSFSSSQLNFKASHLHHGRDFTCNVTFQIQNITKSAQSSFLLHVLYGPRNTSVSASPSASVLLGSSVSLSCSSDGNPAVQNFTWYRENGEKIGSGNHLTINTTDSPHSAFYYCRAQNQYGDHNSSVYLDLLYAPQISPSSSCNSTQEWILCSCEVHGNPSPNLKWHFSNHSFLISEATPIHVESVNDTSLRKSILFFIPREVKDTPTLQCISYNDHGVASQTFFFPKVQCPAEGQKLCVDVSSVLIGAALGASVMMILCAVFLCLRRKTPSGGGATAGFALHDMVIAVPQDEESVYENNAGLSNSLHYSTVEVPNRGGNEIRGLSSLTEYATVHHHDSQHHPEEGARDTGMGGTRRNVMMQRSAEEETLYGNITLQRVMEENLGNVDHDEDVIMFKETPEDTESSPEQLERSHGEEEIYTQVKPRHRKQE